MHELVIARLAPGKTLADLASGAEGRGGPPPRPLSAAFRRWMQGLHAALPRYARARRATPCFASFPMPRTEEHLAHGMAKQVTVS